MWAIEGTGSYGSGLTTFLLEQGEWVVEIDRPARPARRNGAKSDELDAVRAAREALAREHLAQPRRRGEREAMRVLLATRQGAVLSRTRATTALHALVVKALEGIRNQLRHLDTDALLSRCARLRTGPSQSIEHRATITALRSTARRALVCEAEAADLESALELLVSSEGRELLTEPCVGVVSAAAIFNAWSHRGRIRTEAAFGMLSGAAPSRFIAADPSASASTGPGTADSTARSTRSPVALDASSRDEGLRGASVRRGQDARRDQALPQAPSCPATRQVAGARVVGHMTHNASSPFGAGG